MGVPNRTIQKKKFAAMTNCSTKLETICAADSKNTTRPSTTVVDRTPVMESPFWGNLVTTPLSYPERNFKFMNTLKI